MDYPQHRDTLTFPLLFEEYYEKTISFETRYPDSHLDLQLDPHLGRR